MGGDHKAGQVNYGRSIGGLHTEEKGHILCERKRKKRGDLFGTNGHWRKVKVQGGDGFSLAELLIPFFFFADILQEIQGTSFSVRAYN